MLDLRSAGAEMGVEELMATNAGDELHLPQNWTACPDCGVDVRSDMDDCWNCGTEEDHE